MIYGEAMSESKLAGHDRWAWMLFIRPDGRKYKIAEESVVQVTHPAG